MTLDSQKHLEVRETYRIISVDGGGFLGTATASFIDAIEDYLSISFADTFDLFCGTSTGAIIATALATGMSGKEIKDLYSELGQKVFSKRLGGGLFFSKYHGQSLRDSLTNHFGKTTFNDVMARGKSLIVPAYNLRNGKPWVFKTDHNNRLKRDGSLPVASAALASASAPTFFPTAEISYPGKPGPELLIDGGVAVNHPSLLAYTEAISELGRSPDELRLLSLGTPRVSMAPGVNLPSKVDAGVFQWARHLPTIFIDGNSTITHEVMRRLLPKEGMYVRVDFENPSNLSMDNVSPGARDALLALGRQKSTDQTLRDQIQASFCSHEPRV